MTKRNRQIQQRIKSHHGARIKTQQFQWLQERSEAVSRKKSSKNSPALNYKTYSMKVNLFIPLPHILALKRVRCLCTVYKQIRSFFL